MNPQDAIDFSREAIKTCMLVGGPILAASLLIGLLVGVIQAMTQVQDQTVSFVPKILLLLLMIGLCLPWLTQRMIDFSTESFSTPMTHWEGAGSRTTQEIRPAQPLLRKALPTSKLPLNTAAIGLPAVEQTKTRAKTISFIPLAPISPTKPLAIEPPTETVVPANPNQTASPFILPHYRISKAPKIDIEG